jgi:hypothetical protein
MRLLICLLTATAALAQPERPPIDRPPVKAISFAGRLRILPFDFVSPGSTTREYGSPPATFEYKTSGVSSRLGGGAGVEIRLAPNLSLAIDAIFQRGGYQQETSLTDSSDQTTTITETTRAHIWDVPVRLQWHDRKVSRYLPRLFFSAGGVLRHAYNVRTDTDTIYHSGNGVYNDMRSPVTRNVFGATAGAGCRLRDDFGFQFVPEIRYTRMFGDTFHYNGAVSRRGQIEAVLSIVF